MAAHLIASNSRRSAKVRAIDTMVKIPPIANRVDDALWQAELRKHDQLRQHRDPVVADNVGDCPTSDMSRPSRVIRRRGTHLILMRCSAPYRPPKQSGKIRRHHLRGARPWSTEATSRPSSGGLQKRLISAAVGSQSWRQPLLNPEKRFWRWGVVAARCFPSSPLRWGARGGSWEST